MKTTRSSSPQNFITTKNRRIKMPEITLTNFEKFGAVVKTAGYVTLGAYASGSVSEALSHASALFDAAISDIMKKNTIKKEI